MAVPIATNPIAAALNDERAALRRESKARRAAVDVGVVTAVAPLTQTVSVRRVKAGAAGGVKSGCKPFGVESPIAIGDVVRMFRHGGDTFVAPIETNTADAIGKDTRIVLANPAGARRLTFNGEEMITRLPNDGQPVYLSANAARAFADNIQSGWWLFSNNQFNVHQTMSVNRALSTLVETQPAQYLAVGIVGTGGIMNLVGDGIFLPSYCYDEIPSIDEITVGSAGFEASWFIDPASGAGIERIPYFVHPLARLGFRIALPAGATASLKWFPTTAHEITIRNQQQILQSTSAFNEIMSNAHAVRAGGAIAYVGASLDAYSADGVHRRAYDLLFHNLETLVDHRPLESAWREWRESV